MEPAALRLVGAHEIRQQIGSISRRRFYQLIKEPDFPAPVADLAQGQIWLADDVEAWIAAQGRKDTDDHRP